MKYKNLKGSLILCTAALIWGIAFVAQSDAADYVPPFTFNALRSVIGSLALYIFYRIMNIKQKTPFFPKENSQKKAYYLSALLCGVLLAVSINLQQSGITVYPDGVATEARAGFITALYVILVPIFTSFSGKKTNLLVWLGVIIAISGIYLLCFSGGMSGIYIGDILVFICAVSFAFHILLVDKYVAVTGGVKLSIMQFAVCGLISAILALIFEWSKIDINNLIAAAPQILYLGIMSSGIAYTLQIVGQKYAEPAVASISMSLESVFAALGGWLISGNTLSIKEITGCTLVFIAITVAQLPQFFKKA